MNIAVVGGGSLGLVYAGMLSEVSECSLFVRRTEQQELINSDGIQVETSTGSRTYRPVCETEVKRIASAELIIILVKNYDIDAVAKQIQPHATEGSVFLVLQNGLGAAEILNSYFGAERVLVGISGLGARRLTDNTVTVGDNLRTAFGEQLGGVTERIEAFAEIMSQAGLSIETPENINEAVWQKLSFTVAQNAISGLTNLTFGEMADSEYILNLLDGILKEFKQIGEAEGIRLAENLTAGVIANWRSISEHRSSLWQDLQAKCQTEIDYLNGAIVKLGSKHGIATPYNKVICDLTKAAETTRGD